MNTAVTSKEEILRTCREQIQTEGWNEISIRSVAKACNISVGSVYNYFPSKAALVMAIVESIWSDIFRFPEDRNHFKSFEALVRWIFACMEEGETRYPGFFALHASGFLGNEKADGQERMTQSWNHMQEGMYRVLMQDSKVRPNVFDDHFTQRQFTELVFSMILAALWQHKYDGESVLELIRRMLY